MDIEEAKNAKIDLQGEITTMLISFQEKYNITIADVCLHRDYIIGNDTHRAHMFLEIEVKL